MGAANSFPVRTSSEGRQTPRIWLVTGKSRKPGAEDFCSGSGERDCCAGGGVRRRGVAAGLRFSRRVRARLQAGPGAAYALSFPVPPVVGPSRHGRKNSKSWLKTGFRATALGPFLMSARRQGVTRFQHRRKISSTLIRNTLLPVAIRTAPGSCLVIEGVKSKSGVVMGNIPLDFQRRCEQRWAARFARQAPKPSPQQRKHEKQGQRLGAPNKTEDPPAQPGGLRSARAV